MNKEELLELLKTGQVTNQVEDKERGCLATRISEMPEDILRETVIEFIYG